jgi:phospholipase C
MPIPSAMSAPPPPAQVVQLTGTNIGDLLNAKGITWGFFEGGFNLTLTNANGTTGCSAQHHLRGHRHKEGRLHPAPRAVPVLHSTAEPEHTRPSSVGTIGTDGDAANHQYDINDFFDAVKAGNFPAVSFLKAPGYQDGTPATPIRWTSRPSSSR